MARGSFSNFKAPSTNTLSRSALQQAFVFHFNFSHANAANLCGVSKKTIWMSVSSGMGGRKPWMSRTEEERQAAIQEAQRLIDEKGPQGDIHCRSCTNPVIWNKERSIYTHTCGGDSNGTR